MEQFKTLDDLRLYAKTLRKSWYARPHTKGEHPTLYPDNKGNVICGVRKIDYLFSKDGAWVLPTPTMGLSFSGHWQHLKGIYKFLQKRNGGKPVDVGWVFDEIELPSGLAFVDDPKNKQKGHHYLLTVTERMHVSQLAGKLEWIADRMAKIKDATKVLK